MCTEVLVRYACGCEGRTLRTDQCDNDKEVQVRKQRPPLVSEKDLLIAYFAEMCRVESEKRFVQKEHNCRKCASDDIQLAKEVEETGRGKAKYAVGLVIREKTGGK